MITSRFGARLYQDSGRAYIKIRGVLTRFRACLQDSGRAYKIRGVLILRSGACLYCYQIHPISKYTCTYCTMCCHGIVRGRSNCTWRGRNRDIERHPEPREWYLTGLTRHSDDRRTFSASFIAASFPRNLNDTLIECVLLRPCHFKSAELAF